MSKRKPELSSVKLGWVMIDEAASEGNLSYSWRLMLAMTWSDGYVHSHGLHGKNAELAEQVATAELGRLSREYPHVHQLLEFLDARIKKNAKPEGALHGPESLL